MAGVAGVEPTSAVLETVILPLNYTPKKVSNFIISQFFYCASFFVITYHIIGDFMLINYNTKELLKNCINYTNITAKNNSNF